MVKFGVASGEIKPADKKEKSMQEDFLGTLIRKQLQNKGEKKMTRPLAQKILEKNVNDESKTSVDGKPKNDGSIVGIPESKEVDKMLKVNTGGNTIDTPQKDAGGKRITTKAKIQKVLAQRD